MQMDFNYLGKKRVILNVGEQLIGFSSWRRQQPGGSWGGGGPCCSPSCYLAPLHIRQSDVDKHSAASEEDTLTLDRQEGEKVAADTGDTDTVSQASALLFHPKFSPPVTPRRAAVSEATCGGSSDPVSNKKFNSCSAISPHILICE